MEQATHTHPAEKSQELRGHQENIDLNELVCLSNNTKIEPLVFRWYAWGHLISPAQLALNLAFRHLPMLKSFIANPAVHEAASKNPNLLGGSFLELKKQDVTAVKALLNEIVRDGAPLIGFAEDLVKLDRQLQKNETGFSLDHVYDRLASSVGGMVEATYDLNNNVSLRVLEELMYKDELLKAVPQEIALTRAKDSDRNFFLNTPRLDTTERMILPLPFNSEHFDLISASRIEPVPFGQIANALGQTDPAAIARLRSYFDGAPKPRPAKQRQIDGVKVTYFGHACVMVETSDICVLVDPFFAWDENYNGEQPLTFHDLPDHIDYVFITHNHQDHFNMEVLLQLRNRVGTFLVPRNNTRSLADPSMKLILNNIGFRNVTVMDVMERMEIFDGWLMSLPFYGEHSDLDIDSKHALCMEIKGEKFLFLADSDCKDAALYSRIRQLTGPIKTLFVGMECDGAPLTWLYGPYLSSPLSRKDDDSRRLSGCDSNHAWSIVQAFDSTNIYVYAMGQEPWLRFVAGLEYTHESKQIIESDKFVARCKEGSLNAERLYGTRIIDVA
jgi:L-ascorbate metabolism protein UlaG (beta-lactamase superfamily)